MYVGLLNQRWGKLRRAHTLAIYDDARKFVAVARFWKNKDGETVIAIRPNSGVVIVETEAPIDLFDVKLGISPKSGEAA